MPWLTLLFAFFLFLFLPNNRVNAAKKNIQQMHLISLLCFVCLKNSFLKCIKEEAKKSRQCFGVSVGCLASCLAFDSMILLYLFPFGCKHKCFMILLSTAGNSDCTSDLFYICLYIYAYICFFFEVFPLFDMNFILLAYRCSLQYIFICHKVHTMSHFGGAL